MILVDGSPLPEPANTMGAGRGLLFAITAATGLPVTGFQNVAGVIGR